MKIGINASFLRKPDTGIGQVTRGFIEELARSHSSKNKYFLYLEKDIDIELPKNFKKRVFSLGIWRRDDLIRKIWWEKFLLPRYAERDHCDIFISLYQCPTRISKKICHKMLVHDLIPKIFPEYLDNWRKKLYFHLSCQAIRKADDVFTVSQWSKKDIHKYLKIPNNLTTVAYPSISKEFFRSGSQQKDNQILEKYDVYGRYGFYVGGFDLRKNVPVFLQAFKKLIEDQNINDVNLILGGEDKSKYSPLFIDIRKEIDKLELKNRVKPVGFIKQEDLPAFYRQCEFFVLPSLYEGFGLMALEAMASGAPTAVSKTSSLFEVCGNAVLYFNPHDPEEIAQVMGKILRNTKLKHHLSKKGKERAKKFSWKDFAKTILR